MVFSEDKGYSGLKPRGPSASSEEHLKSVSATVQVICYLSNASFLKEVTQDMAQVHDVESTSGVSEG